MALTLQVVSYKNRTPTDEISASVNEAACTIGRASNNDLVLPDIERIISHRHATVEFENGVYYLTDNSTNGSFINHAPEPVGQGNKVPLHDGDMLSIGGYDCAISIKAQEKPAPGPLLDKSSWQPPLHSEPLVEKPDLDNAAYREPLIPTPLSSDGGSGSSMEQDYFKPPEPILEDWDVMTGIHLEKQEKASPLIPDEKDTPVIPEDINKPDSIPPQPVIPDIIPPQQINIEKPAAKPRVTAPISSENTANLNQQAVDAFLAGAGLTNAKIEPDKIASFMNTSGQLLREMTHGFRQIMDSRTNLKGEFRLGMTTIQPAENNPLKFSIDVDDALNKLLFPPPKGYLPPLIAIQDATDDLQAHQMAFLAGLRAALSSLVALFDPESFEKDLQNLSAVDNLLPSKKKARYWEAFKTQYRQTAADAENDFLHFLGNEFAAAYDQQIRILKSNRQK